MNAPMAAFLGGMIGMTLAAVILPLECVVDRGWPIAVGGLLGAVAGVAVLAAVVLT